MRIWRLFILFTFIIFLSGCSMVKAPGDLIESPKPQDELKKQLSEKVKQILPASTEFISAKQGKEKQSFLIEDINGDGQQEAFVLYRGTEGNRHVHVLVLQKQENEWRELSTLETNYPILDYFSVHDLDEDGVGEVVMGGGPADFETEKLLLIYQWDSDNLQKTIEKTYELIDIADYDADKKLDILLVHGKRREAFTAELFQYVNSQFTSLSSVDLDAYAFHENTESGKLQDGAHAFFIDSGVGAHSMITEILTYDSGQLVLIQQQEIKAYPLYSKDINGDGVIEVGGMYIPKGWEDTAFADIPFLETYSTYSSVGTSTKVEERYTNREQRFYIQIPPSWHGKVTIEKMKNGIRLADVSNHNPLFEVKWAEKGALDTSSKTILMESKDKIFYTDIKENELFPLTQFHPLEEEF